MEGLERCRRKRKDPDPKPTEWGSEALKPGEGDQKKKLATVAYRFLQIHHHIPNFTRTNPLHLATVMALSEREARPGDGIKAKLLRDFHLFRRHSRPERSSSSTHTAPTNTGHQNQAS